MKVVGKTDDSYKQSNLKRIYYTVEIEEDKVVDIMISEENECIYTMENEDGTNVYDYNGNTYPDYEYNKDAATDLAVTEYEKEYGVIMW